MEYPTARMASINEQKQRTNVDKQKNTKFIVRLDFSILFWRDSPMNHWTDPAYAFLFQWCGDTADLWLIDFFNYLERDFSLNKFSSPWHIFSPVYCWWIPLNNWWEQFLSPSVNQWGKYLTWLLLRLYPFLRHVISFSFILCRDRGNQIS